MDSDRAIPAIEDFDDSDFNPFLADETVYGDAQPYPRLAELRREAPVHELNYFEMFGKGGSTDESAAHSQRRFLVVGYDAVAKILNNPATFSNKSYAFTLGLSFGRTLTAMDAPEHGRFRRIFQKAFLPGVVAQWGQKLVDPVVSQLVGAFEARGSVDLVSEFTIHYPFQVIYRMLGMPERDVATFHRLAMAQTLFYAPMMGYVREAARKLGVYFQGMIEARRAAPGNDLVSVLATAEVDGEQLPDDVLIAFLRQLINAGGDTTYRTTSIMLTALLQDPPQLQAILADRSLLAAAIDETVRWDTPALLQTRIAAHDTLLEGVHIPAGSFVDACAGAANRDETRFANGEKFDIFRDRTHRHFGFGLGPHICVGQHLARLEMQRAMTALLDVLPNIRLDPDKPPPIILGSMMRVPRHVHAQYG